MVYAQGASSAMNVSTWHNGNNRTGWQQDEIQLTVKNVSAPKSFGLVWQWFAPPPAQPNTPIGRVYAQPLAVASVPTKIQGCQPCDLVIVATETDMLYAFDAESTSTSPLWSANLATLLNPNYTYVDCNDLGGTATSSFLPCNVVGNATDPNVGVTGTPVVDTASNTLYVVAAVQPPPSDGPAVLASYYLIAIDITTGNLASTSPPSYVLISGTVTGQAPPWQNGNECSTTAGNSTVAFNSDDEIQRAALLLLSDANSTDDLYVAFAPGPTGSPNLPSEFQNGWIFGYSYSSAGFASKAIFNSTPDGTGGGTWGAGAGPASNSKSASANTYIYVATGNGTFDVNSRGVDYGDSLLEFNTSLSSPPHSYYTPADVFSYPNNTYKGRCAKDEDLDSGGVLLPTGYLYQSSSYNGCGGSGCSVVVNADKESKLYVTEQGALGGYSSPNGTQIQDVLTPCSGAPTCQPLDTLQGYWASPAYWSYVSGNQTQYMLYYSPTTKTMTAAPYPIYAYALATTGVPIPQTATATTGSILFCQYSPTPSVSWNGTTQDPTTGIVWAIEQTQNSDNMGGSGPDCNGTPKYQAALHAFAAVPKGGSLPELYDSRSLATPIGNGTPFSVPTVFNGYVYVGTQNRVNVFGLCNGNCLD